jgi:hypothetical protein
LDKADSVELRQNGTNDGMPVGQNGCQPSRNENHQRSADKMDANQAEMLAKMEAKVDTNQEKVDAWIAEMRT